MAARRQVVTLDATVPEEPWRPRVVDRIRFSGACGGGDETMEIKTVLLRGAFTRHAHAETDEAFLVLGPEALEIDLWEEGEGEGEAPTRTVTLRGGDMFVVPRGVPHCPRAPDAGCRAVLFEPAGVFNTGDAVEPPAALRAPSPE